MKKILCLIFVMSFVLLPLIVSAHTVDDPFSTDLIAGGGKGKSAMDVGDVLVWNDADNLYVKYVVDAPWCITETHLQVATSLDGIPQQKGNPIPGLFDHSGKHECVPDVVYTIPLGDWSEGTKLYIAAQAVVAQETIVKNKPVIQYATAWGAGDSFTGKNWATYFTYVVQSLATCGDGSCDPGEDAVTCPQDCDTCGNGICGPYEDENSCPADCTVCGNGICGTYENENICPDDCTVCGNGICGTYENESSCPDDCTECGNGICGTYENENSCPDDCTECGNGICGLNEDVYSCPQDCDTCGNGFCGPYEGEYICPDDCTECGNYVCGPYEDENICPNDCTECGNGICGPYEDENICPEDCTDCGNGFCGLNEDVFSCPQDCDYCGNDICGPYEDASSCPADCGCAAQNACGYQAPGGCFCDEICLSNGDCCADACSACGICEAPVVCGDGICQPGETDVNCAADCGCAAPNQTCNENDLAPGGCFCDSQCLTYDDCCSDACSVCGRCS